MKQLFSVSILAMLLFSCTKEFQSSSKTESKNLNKTVGDVAVTAVVGQITPNHIVYVWFENKGYSQIIGSSAAPYINSLKTKGTLFTNAHGITHPSYPNYLAFFSGSTQGISSGCIDGTPFSGANLYTALNAVGAKFRWYSEGLPSAGSGICTSGYYAEKHNPTSVFSNVPQTTVNLPLTSLNMTDTSQFKNWPQVAHITPNLQNDMHDGTIQTGDAWLKSHFDKYVQWAMKNNSILVVYFDEDNQLEGNRIPVIYVGQHIKPNYQVTGTFNHYSFAKQNCRLFNASVTWNANINNASSPQGFWQ